MALEKATKKNNKKYNCFFHSKYQTPHFPVLVAEYHLQMMTSPSPQNDHKLRTQLASATKPTTTPRFTRCGSQEVPKQKELRFKLN